MSARTRSGARRHRWEHRDLGTPRLRTRGRLSPATSVDCVDIPWEKEAALPMRSATPALGADCGGLGSVGVGREPWLTIPPRSAGGDEESTGSAGSVTPETSPRGPFGAPSDWTAPLAPLSTPADADETVELTDGRTGLSKVVATRAAVCVIGLLGRPGSSAAPAGRPVVKRSTRPSRIPTAAPMSRMNARGRRIPILP
jgi:hypothetical protein